MLVSLFLFLFCLFDFHLPFVERSAEAMHGGATDAIIFVLLLFLAFLALLRGT